MAVTVGRGLDALVAQVALDYRQGDTCLDKPAGVGMPEIMHPGLFGEALSLALARAGSQTLGLKRSWLRWSRRLRAETLTLSLSLRNRPAD